MLLKSGLNPSRVKTTVNQGIFSDFFQYGFDLLDYRSAFADVNAHLMNISAFPAEIHLNVHNHQCGILGSPPI
jgi:hypothetical protein